MGPQLGCYGDPWARTPHLDALAASGLRCTQATVPYAVCSPARAAFLTGLWPQQNGHLGLATHKFEFYRPDTPNIVTHLQAGGYRTGIVGKLHVNPESAFPFDYARLMHEANFKRREPMETYVDSAREFWRGAGDRPWFLTVNFPDAHLPFVRQADGRPEQLHDPAIVRPPDWAGADSPRLRELAADYHNCITRVDEWIGQLLAQLAADGLEENTLVFFFCDHGPQFPRGKATVYEGALRVPLIIRGPGVSAQSTACDVPVSTVDLLPTVLTAAGLPVPAELPGRSLQALWQGGANAFDDRCVHAITTGSFPGNCFIQESIRQGRWKLIWTPRQPQANGIARTYLDPTHPQFVVTGLTTEERTGLGPEVAAAYARWEQPPEYELYDLTNDPHEWRNLAGDPAHATVRDGLIARLRQWQQAIADPLADAANREAFISEQLEYLDLRQSRMPDFHWRHVEHFRLWRAQALNPDLPKPAPRP